MERQHLNKPKNMKKLPAEKSLRHLYAEVMKLRQAVCRTLRELRAPSDVNRLVSK